MIKKIHLISIGLAMALWPSILWAQMESPDKTIVNSPTAARKLVGKQCVDRFTAEINPLKSRLPPDEPNPVEVRLKLPVLGVHQIFGGRELL
jgi:hypothetical protein